MQESLFNSAFDSCEIIPLRIAGHEVAELNLYASAFSEQADVWLQQLLQQTPWQQDQIRIAGKVLDIPRLQCWYGDSKAYYQYSGIHLTPQPWSPLLLEIKQRIESLSGFTFNSALINLYRDGQDSVSWHADDEKELGENPVIASISLGQQRPFSLKPKKNLKLCPSLDLNGTPAKPSRLNIMLNHGSLLIMKAGVQSHYLHCIAKQDGIDAPRVNITFRKVTL
ncbi:MAG: alpha-ketoglutarate-dependent dioxygenase AlkB [Pseudomonadales bacterium]|nr:alpha-ketoglutarate-dependent dioxygenase AlkB [Pseudomonadales bacterium]